MTTKTTTLVQANAVEGITRRARKQAAKVKNTKAKAKNKTRRTNVRKGIKQVSQHHVDAIVRGVRGDVSATLRNVALTKLSMFRESRANVAEAMQHGKSITVVMALAEKAKADKHAFRHAMKLYRSQNMADAADVLETELTNAVVAALRSFAIVNANDEKAETRAHKIGAIVGEDRIAFRNAMVALLETVKFPAVASL